MTETTPEAGWYQDASAPGMARWWDGAQWTEHTASLDGPEPPAPTAVQARSAGAPPDASASQQQSSAPEPTEDSTPDPDPTGHETQAVGAYIPAPTSQPTPTVPSGGRSPRMLVLLLILLVVVAGGAAVWWFAPSLLTGIEEASESTTAGIDEAEDTAAQSDVRLLQTAITAFVAADASGEMPTVTSDGSVYLIEGASGESTEVGTSSGVELGGFTGKDATDWCVWVTSASGTSYQGEPGGSPSEGSCS
ncbi:DUF2510 domain-containing protein [Demequina sp. NBRC 110054]|uniref:DUF2510 domain-containing protein n=1 Tax=Demequina sp. NBRC 110054 TaxID=1570343 RepID=UPI000A078F33|nr:DUF2510 domain-containing protein [Demequina sp. NBRC 110054]